MKIIAVALVAPFVVLAGSSCVDAAGGSVTYRSPHAVLTLNSYNGKQTTFGTGQYCQVNSGAQNGCWRVTFSNPPSADQPPDIISFYKQLGGYWTLRAIAPFFNTCNPNCASSKTMKFGSFYYKSFGAPTKTQGVFKLG
ncbi:MAG TPA: hypothetical protein VFA78_02695 [Chloroflexota bacterium]|nr:hypothetical protein [Chloroflexota bacterium]